MCVLCLHSFLVYDADSIQDGLSDITSLVGTRERCDHGETLRDRCRGDPVRSNERLPSRFATWISKPESVMPESGVP